MSEKRFLINHNGILRESFKLSFTETNPNLYLFLSGQFGAYRYGRSEFKKDETEIDIDTNSGTKGNKNLHLSYHESGEIHIRCSNSYLSARNKKTKLYELKWKHIISVQISDVNCLPLFKKKNTKKAIVLESFHGESCRFLVFADNESNIITVDIDNKFEIQCPNNSRIVTFGYKYIEQLPLNVTGRGGLIVICGWDINQQGAPACDILWIQGLPQNSFIKI